MGVCVWIIDLNVRQIKSIISTNAFIIILTRQVVMLKSTKECQLLTLLERMIFLTYRESSFSVVQGWGSLNVWEKLLPIGQQGC